MKIKTFFMVTALALTTIGANAGGLAGMYQTIDDATHQPKAIVVLYEYMDGDDVELAGRIVATYDVNGEIKTDSKYVGMDIIWDMEWDADDNKYEDGKIKDPQNGKVYKSVIWQDMPGKLNVRGKVGPFGRTQVWRVLSDDAIPDQLRNLNTTNWKPSIGK